MSANRDQEEEIFDAARELAAHERAAYLANVCGQDADLRQRIEGMLAADADAGEFFKTHDAPVPTVILAEASPSPSIEKAGDKIGRYKLLQQIGEGGCGVVYMAEQEEPVRRRVALKVIKIGMDTKQVIARFEAERQALALMDHPNIAKVLDAGATETGRPYFVMELVRGIKITDFCDENKLSTADRLKLFIQVCQAIQHAHQKGVIHRDIKPSNILVTINDGVPVPKVIDFGIAKATAGRLTDQTLFTAFEQFIGTPAYMSPEQAVMTSLDIDTRSDIYSLGVLLYELLTGKTPFDAKELMAAGLDEMRRTIREQEPPRPSARLSTMAADALTTTANEHHTDAPKLVRALRGDLDWIVMKCLEKDRTRRYDTANGLAADITRHLNFEPVLARPPSTADGVKKFVRRNKGVVLAAAMLLLVLCAGIVGTGWGLVRAQRARQREAQRADGERQAKREALAAAEAERKAKETAVAREAETQAVLDFVENKVFAAARPEGQDGGLGQDVMLRRAIEAALPFVDQGLTNQPLIEARLRMTVGWSFWCLGDAKIATEQFQAARLLYTQHRGSNHPDTLRSMYNLALGYDDLGRHAESLKLHEETLALQKEILGPDHPDTLQSMLSVAFRYGTAKRYDEAIQLGLEVLDLRIKMLGPDHLDTLTSKMVLARSYGMAGRNAEAIHLLEEILLHKAKLGPRHPNTLRSMRNLAWCYAKAGRETDALKLREEVLPLVQSSLGFDHRETLESMIALAASYAFAGREAEAIKLREEALGIFKTKLGPTNADSLDNVRRLAELLTHSKDPKLRNPTRVVDLAKELAEANPGDGALWHSLGVAHYRASNWKSAVDALDTSMELRKGGDAFGWLYLAMAHWQLGNKDEARLRYAGSFFQPRTRSSESLTRLRSEAAELLGVTEKK